MVIEIGRLCMKIAGRDAGKKCVVVDVLEGNYVLVDGETRRKKCNITHLEPLDNVLKIKKNASHDEITKAFKELNIEARNTKPKQKKERPVAKARGGGKTPNAVKQAPKKEAELKAAGKK